MAGVNQYSQFKGFIGQQVPFPLEQMLGVARENKAAEMAGELGQQDLQTREPVLPGLDTENQRAFEESMIAKSNELASQYANKQLDPLRFKFEVEKLKNAKKNDLAYNTRLASYAKATEANETIRKQAIEGKLDPILRDHDYLKTEWDSGAQGIFRANPASYTGYDPATDWNDVKQTQIMDDQDPTQIGLFTDTDGRQYTKRGITDQQVLEFARNNARKVISSPQGTAVANNVRATNPKKYAGMSDFEVMYDYHIEAGKARQMALAENVPVTSDGNYSRGSGSGEEKEPPPTFGTTVPGHAVSPNTFTYADPDAKANDPIPAGSNAFDEYADLNRAPVMIKTTLDNLSNKIYRDAEGNWKNKKDNTNADSDDVAELEFLEGQYRLHRANQRDIYNTAAEAINGVKAPGSKIALVKKQDPRLGEEVVYDWVDVSAEKERQSYINQQAQYVKKALSDFQNGTLNEINFQNKIAQIAPQDVYNENGTVNRNLDFEQIAQSVIENPEPALVKKFPSLAKGTWRDAHMSRDGKDFKQRIEDQIDERYEKEHLFTPNIQLLNTGEHGDKISQQISEAIAGKDGVTSAIPDANYVDLKGKPFFDDKNGNKEYEWERKVRGLTVDPNTQQVSAAVMMTPLSNPTGNGKDRKMAPDFTKSVEAFVPLGTYGDDALADQYPGVDVQAIKDYAAQIGQFRSYGFSNNGSLETKNGDVIKFRFSAKDKSEIHMQELDPFTGKPTGKEKSYKSLFNAAADLAKHETTAISFNEVLPKFQQGIESVETSDGDPRTRNGTSSALGRHQIMFSEHKDKIKKFLIDNGYLPANTDKITSDELKNIFTNRADSGEIQDKFFQEAWAPIMYEEVNDPKIFKLAHTFNKTAERLGIQTIESIDDLMALDHLLGKPAFLEFLNSKRPDRYKPPGKNKLAAEYLEDYKAGKE